MPQYRDIPAVPVNQIFLHLFNPRFEPVETEAEAINRLCTRENVYPLAADIVELGINPLERVALFPLQPAKGKKDRTSYVAAEGNRRLCAIKLLNDPDLAPTKLRAAFKELAEEWKPVRTLPAVLFEDEADVRVWLQRIHGGEQGGIGRRRWNAEQQQRFSGGGRNKLAAEFLDYAQERKLITAEQRKGKLTTVQRFVEKESFREAIGLDGSDPDHLKLTRPKEDFEKLTKVFIADLLKGKDVNSRMNKPEILDYARGLTATKNLSGQRTPPSPIKAPMPKGSGKKKKAPTPPQQAPFIRYELEIADALERLGVHKLQSLYHSITNVDLPPNTPLIAVGVWSFFETLTACAGRDVGTDFSSFFSNQRLANLGFGSGKALTPLRTALEHIRDYGNNTKHHNVAAVFNGDQLNNDMETLKGVALKTIQEAVNKNAAP